jgi:hypothetical protein
MNDGLNKTLTKSETGSISDTKAFAHHVFRDAKAPVNVCRKACATIGSIIAAFRNGSGE